MYFFPWWLLDNNPRLKEESAVQDLQKQPGPILPQHLSEMLYVKFPPPRPLTKKESLDSLDHWKSQFRTFFKRDDTFRRFLGSDFKWDPMKTDFGFTPDKDATNPSIITVTAKDKAEDFTDLLNVLSGFLPHSYLTTRISKDTKCWSDIWDLIYQHYNCKVSGDTLLDFEALKRESDENYLQFFERLLQHARLHLAQSGAEVGHLKLNKNEEMSISLMNMFALQWLRKSSPDLINIVKTEFSTELKSGVQLAKLVPDIAPNIDNLLSRYSSSSVRKVSPEEVHDEEVEDEKDDDDDQAGVRFTRQPARYPGRSQARSNQPFGRGGHFSKPTGIAQPPAGGGQRNSFSAGGGQRNSFFCPGCKKLNDNHNASIDFRHNPIKCPRKFALRSIQEGFLEDEESQDDFGNNSNDVALKVSNSHLLQSSQPQSRKQNGASIHRVLLEENESSNSVTFNITINHSLNKPTEQFKVQTIESNDEISEPKTALDDISNQILRIEQRKHLWDGSVRKEKSPSVDTVINKSAPCKSVIDEGSEINVIDHKFCLRWKIRFSPSVHAATAAGSSTMKVEGQTVKDVVLDLLDGDVKWNLGTCIVIKNLGVDLLIGEPGKVDNNICTKPHKRILETFNTAGRKVTVKYSEHPKVETNHVKKVYDTKRTDFSDLMPPASLNLKECFLQDIKLDPDDQLSKDWKNKFYGICSQFKDVINPNPGRYNGYYGDIDCSINFASSPPPSVKARIPNYPHSKLQLMGKLMDDMERMGVLQTPESAGVVPTFVVPSMLVPKDEAGQWRMVSDFTPLNIHIKKLPTVNPTIEEVKQKLAKYKYNIELDLSNYFWQQGMKLSDRQYLGTLHPFKGLRVYAVEPQGLRNASEHGYERLARIFGDMCGEERMARMADGLYILGDTLQELSLNLIEVLDRARNCGLTFKPKKIVIVPSTTVLFGWKRIGAGWHPCDHSISPLSTISPPPTAKQIRSFIGSYKQMSHCIKDYAVLLSPLEGAVAGKSSGSIIQWTDELLSHFEQAKESLKNIKTIYVPKPSDKLDVFCDYSANAKAVGGKLVITRTDEDGSVLTLLGGHFSIKLNKHQQNWWPCEGEALGVRLTAQHFSPHIRESLHVTKIHTDNMPTVHAWKRLKTGAFSSSARVASFLTALSTLRVEVVHKPGKDNLVSDYNSRHPNVCLEPRCQICQFSSKLELMGDNLSPNVRSIRVEDIMNGSVKMPFNQRSAWLKTQNEDRAHRMLLELIRTSQAPEPKRTKGDFTTLKRLHGLYRSGTLKD